MNIVYENNNFAQEMKDYLRSLEKQKKASALNVQKEAKKALKRTGVLNSSGKTKKKIVSWE